MKINVTPRSLERFEQNADGSITVWKPEDAEFPYLIDADESFMQTLYDGEIYEVEKIWGDSEGTLLYDACNDLVFRFHSKDIIDYNEGKKVTLYPPTLEGYELFTVDRWLENLEEEFAEWQR